MIEYTHIGGTSAEVIILPDLKKLKKRLVLDDFQKKKRQTNCARPKQLPSV